MYGSRRFGSPLPALTVLLLLAIVQSIQAHVSNQAEITNNLLHTMADSNTLDAQFVGQSNSFATKLYQAISAKTVGENVVISPFSIGACLSLAAMGASGPTAEEMYSVLQYGTPNEKQTVADNYRRLMTRLATDSTVNVANKVYVMQDYAIKSAFNAIATESFQSEAEAVNFAESEVAAKKINGWVEQKTNNKIKDLISPDALDELSRMVLVNAVHFKGTWTYQFDPQLTRPFPFWTSETESKNVPMMNIKKHFAYNNFEQHGFSALELTYGASDMTMLILLPNARTGLAALEEKLPSLDFADLTSQMHKQEVEVFLPKFKIEFTRDLNDDLKALGMGRMFSDSAEFPDLLEENEPLKVSKVVHKAFIEVNEEGTEAAAATAAVVRVKRALINRLKVRLDHPFLYVLLMGSSRQTAFIGRYVKPDQSDVTEVNRRDEL
ncbi:serine protease inhibitor 42Dd-like isoform X4 [Anopheles stephensi]|uniref:serine protease inhibitor 42Dd-like isoform X4 n=1 Tax=Anopheles stephensi TaxID=30069 RepID=UPI0016589150|nr:serine protease inhibitor 42Dd-like isoform X4 [Anopheles stephensi]